MGMWKLKSCPRCGGDMLLDRDHYSWYEQCLQCSYLNELKSIAEFMGQAVEEDKELIQAGGTRRRKRSLS